MAGSGPGMKVPGFHFFNLVYNINLFTFKSPNTNNYL